MSSNAFQKNISKTITLRSHDFRVNISDEALADFQQLLKLSKVAAPTYENAFQEVLKFGISAGWIKEAKQYWEKEYDWRKHERQINSFPNYTTVVKDDDGHAYKIHYVALFSDKPDAVPLALFHGWPGSFLEFLPILDILRTKYSPETLPYNVVVPSLPGFAFSDSPPLDKDFRVEDAVRLMDKLMVGLGFGSGYVVQGGDYGSIISNMLAIQSPSVKAIHLNSILLSPPADAQMDKLTEEELKNLSRAGKFNQSGMGYGLIHAQRPSTISLAVASNPVALLAWVGEKYVEWSGETPSLDTILTAMSLYWFTETFPSSIYFYRQLFPPGGHFNDSELIIKNKKPFGYSAFMQDILVFPESWVATRGNLVFFRSSNSGGHFAALEKPQVLLKDVEDFIAQVWTGAKGL